MDNISVHKHTCQLKRIRKIGEIRKKPEKTKGDLKTYDYMYIERSCKTLLLC